MGRVVTRLAVLRPGTWVALWVAAAVVARLPFVGSTLSPDEGGLLMVAGQWGPGSSLYGDYWVDRPPLLIALFALADAAGGRVALQVLGLVAVAVAVVAAWALARAVAPDTSAQVVVPGVVAFALASPLMGARPVNGELLAVPFVLVGLVAAVRAVATTRWRAVGWGVVAGAAGASAALVKQNFVDVIVFVVAVGLLVVVRRGDLRRRLAVVVAAVAVGALATAGVLVGAAVALGSGLDELWSALVVFRSEAAAVISASASEDTPNRLGTLVGAFALTGVPLVLLSLARGWRRPPEEARASGPVAGLDLRLPALAVVAWELVGVIGGGSYWLHYLIGLVPGIALVCALGHRPGEHVRWTRRWVAVCGASTAVSVVLTLLVTGTRGAEPAIDYLRGHVRPGDTGVVAFGQPNILQEAGLASPYEHLWSLPVRVLDPDLDELTELLAGSERPDWVIVSGASLASWGIDPSRAEPVLEREYVERASTGEYTIFERRR